MSQARPRAIENARRRNRLHNVEFVYYRLLYPLDAPTQARLDAAFKQFAPNNRLSVMTNVAGTECIVKAPPAVPSVVPLEVFDEPPRVLMATPQWRAPE